MGLSGLTLPPIFLSFPFNAKTATAVFHISRRALALASYHPVPIANQSLSTTTMTKASGGDEPKAPAKKRCHLRNSRRDVNNLLKNHCREALNSQTSDRTSPHPLFVTTRSDLGCLWNNTVVVSSFHREYIGDSKRHSEIVYSKVDFVGRSVKTQWSQSCRKSPFDLRAVHRNTLIVVTPLTKDMMEMGITFVGRFSSDANLLGRNKSGINSEHPYVVLLLSCLASEDSLIEWPQNICSVLRKMKPNIVKPNGKGHFMSSGKCYAFGSGAMYGRNKQDHNLTIAPYATKKNGELSSCEFCIFEQSLFPVLTVDN